MYPAGGVGPCDQFPTKDCHRIYAFGKKDDNVDEEDMAFKIFNR